MAKVIDVHVHIGGPGDSGSGCLMSSSFMLSPAFAFMLLSLGASPKDITDNGIKKIILDAINGSSRVHAAVVLALDGVYKDDGKRMCKAESHLVVPNDYVIELARQSKNKKVLFGASVNPFRPRMLKEVNRCLENGAVLFKWIPSSQQIDPQDPRCLPFYDALADAQVPLLCHTGPEHAVPTSNPDANEFNDPARLRLALERKVKVIAAHCATPYLGDLLEKGYFEELLGMLKEHTNLYADISAFCVPTRIPHLRRILREIKSGKIAPEKFLFGSDFPIPIIDINQFTTALDPVEMAKHLLTAGNPLDRNYEILEEFGVKAPIFTSALQVLRLEGGA